MGTVIGGMRKLRPVMPALEVIGGVLVILVGILIFLDRFTVLNRYFTSGVGAVTGAEGVIQGLGGVTGPAGIFVAFAAGVIAFISPCCLPMVPAYIAHLAGVSSEQSEFSPRAGTFRHALAFVLGFSAVFVVLGASLGAVGFLVRDQLPTIQKVAGIALVVMGLNLAGVIRIPWLYRTYQVDVAGGSRL
jgi:cytochrome c biogenesis protein CcdA